MIVEIQYEARCKHCMNCKPFYIGKLTRHKCIHGWPDNKPKTFKAIAEWDGKMVRLKDKACNNFNQ